MNAAQKDVLAWIVTGCPPGTYPEGSFAHRVTARALQSRGLVDISGRGPSWRAVPTERGRLWPEVTLEDDEVRRVQSRQERRQHRESGAEVGDTKADRGIVGRVLRRAPRKRRPAGSLPVEQVNKQETYMRYKVVVTRVQVAEKWVRATDEEDAARKVQEEFAKPYSYFGNWETKASEVEIIEAEQTTVIHPSKLSESGPMLLSLKDAAAALGVPYSALYDLTNRGDIEYTKLGSRKYIQRESLMQFLATNTHTGYHAG